MRPLLTLSLALLACATAGCAEDVQILGGSGGSGGNGGDGGDSTTTTTGLQGGGGSGTTTSTLNTGGQGGGGGDPTGDGVHFVRFGYRSGQETVGDFCASYAGGVPEGNYEWKTAGLLGVNGLSAAGHDGMKKITAYLPLKGEPVAFGYVYPGMKCEDGDVIQQAPAPSGVDHFTVIAVPYSFEPISLWVVGDPVAENEADPTPDGFRVVNAGLNSYPMEVASTTGANAVLPHGTFEFGNAPTEYFQAAFDHLWSLEVKEVAGPGFESSVTFDFTGMDLMPVRPRRTFYVSGIFPDLATVLACADTMATLPGDPKSSDCFFVNGTP